MVEYRWVGLAVGSCRVIRNGLGSHTIPGGALCKQSYGVLPTYGRERERAQTSGNEDSRTSGNADGNEAMRAAMEVDEQDN